VNCLSWNPLNNILTSGSSDNTICHFDLRSNSLLINKLNFHKS